MSKLKMEIYPYHPYPYPFRIVNTCGTVLSLDLISFTSSVNTNVYGLLSNALIREEIETIKIQFIDYDYYKYLIYQSKFKLVISFPNNY